MEISCPGCQQTLRVADTDAGRKARCPKCETVFSIPEFSGSDSGSTGGGFDSAAQSGAAGGETSDPFGGGFGQSGSFGSTSSPKNEPFGSSESSSRSAESSPNGGIGGADDLWHLRIEDGRTFGPVPKSELDQWCAENRVTATCFLRRHSDPNWVEAGNVYPHLGKSGPVSSNPFRDDLKPTGEIGAGGYGQTGYRQPHRGGVILTFGILGLFGCGCLIFLGFGIAAWVMGANDLKAMNEGRMDDSGRSLTQTGQILGMIGCGIAIVATILSIVGNVANL